MTVTVDLRLGDCLELMKGMADGSVNLIATDPPYNIGMEISEEYSDIAERRIHEAQMQPGLFDT